MMKQRETLMLVEDNEAHAELAMFALEEAGHRIILMKDGKEAVDYLRQEGEWAKTAEHVTPLLIMLDLKMPVMNGRQVLRALKCDDRFKSIPVIMLTSSGRESDMRECYELGANSYIVKPVTYSEFQETMKNIPEYWLNVNRLPEN